MQIFRADKVLIVVGTTVNRCVEKVVDDFWLPPDFHAVYVIVDDFDFVIKYRQARGWHAQVDKTDLAVMVERLMMIYQ
jgi:hypothetical protein